MLGGIKFNAFFTFLCCWCNKHVIT